MRLRLVRPAVPSAVPRRSRRAILRLLLGAAILSVCFGQLRAAQAPSAPAAASARTDITLSRLAETFGRANYPAFERAIAAAPNLDRLIREVRGGQAPWRAAPRPSAVFALELALAGLNRPDRLTRHEAQSLLSHRLDLFRRAGRSDAFECAWHVTAAAGVMGLLDGTVALPFIRRALDRCRSEPRLHLALAVATDQLWPSGTTVRLPGQKDVVEPDRRHRQEVARLYATAARYPETATEANVRAAWFALRLGDLDRALALIGAAREADDAALNYFRLLVYGQILQAHGRIDDAASAFRDALGAWPRAQSARVSLLVLEAGHGSRSVAAGLAESIQTAPANDADPWWRYWQGDFRDYGRRIAALRELAR